MFKNFLFDRYEKRVKVKETNKINFNQKKRNSNSNRLKKHTHTDTQRLMDSIGNFEYNKKDLIGHGAFAIVYKGRQKNVLIN